MHFDLSQYPAPPNVANKLYTQPTAEFKRQVRNVLLLCIFFLITYATVVALALGIAVLLVALAAALALEVPNTITLMLAFGSLALAISIVIFVINSLIIKLDKGREGAVQIFENDEPLLFEFIKRVTEEVGSPFPKKIFLVDDFNAFVAYDSVFLSMFFPRRKNLYIGIALVNSLTISEFKGVMGHEFGHFSQKSMKLGAYVYHFNLIIHKILFDNERYQNTLEKWGNSTWYFSIFKGLTNLIINGIQWIMRHVYVLLNKEHMSLSRQMEFHADAVAASVSGSKCNITAHYRSDFASNCYSALLSFYTSLVKENRKAENLYTDHLCMMKLLANENEIPLHNGLPMVEANSLEQLGNNRVIIKDQWASHPSNEDRIAFFKEMNIEAVVVDSLAWDLFTDPLSVQMLFTDKLYEQIVFEDKAIPVKAEEFELKYIKHMGVSSLPRELNGYYNNRNIAPFELEVSDNETMPSLSGELFADKYTRLPVVISHLENDIATLDYLIAGGTGIKSFDFDGEKHESHLASVIKDKLTVELNDARLQIDAYDKAIYYHTLHLCDTSDDMECLKLAYTKMFNQTKRFELDVALYNEVCTLMNPLYSRMEPPEIRRHVLELTRKEADLKKRYTEMVNDPEILADASLSEYRIQLQNFVDTNHIYYNSEQYLNEELQLLTDSLNAFLALSIDFNFLVKKDALQLQSEILKGQREKLAFA